MRQFTLGSWSVLIIPLPSPGASHLEMGKLRYRMIPGRGIRRGRLQFQEYGFGNVIAMMRMDGAILGVLPATWSRPSDLRNTNLVDGPSKRCRENKSR